MVLRHRAYPSQEVRPKSNQTRRSGCHPHFSCASSKGFLISSLMMFVVCFGHGNQDEVPERVHCHQLKHDAVNHQDLARLAPTSPRPRGVRALVLTARSTACTAFHTDRSARLYRGLGTTRRRRKYCERRRMCLPTQRSMVSCVRDWHHYHSKTGSKWVLFSAGTKAFVGVGGMAEEEEAQEEGGNQFRGGGHFYQRVQRCV